MEFTYDSKQYVLPGDSEVELSKILNTVGLTGEVSAVEVSDESLFSAKKCKIAEGGSTPEKDGDGNPIEDENGTWFVFAHKAFSSKEWMKVTIGGVVYEIAVTDDQNDGITLVQPTGGTVSYEIKEETSFDSSTHEFVTKATVYLHNTPAEGYRFVCYRVTDASGNAILVRTKTNLYTGEISGYFFDKQTATVTAEFEKLPEAHAVNVNQPTGGLVSVSKYTASEGDRVDLSGQAESGYLFSRFVVTKVSDGSSVAVKDASLSATQHSWYFTMPDEAVNVTAEFKAAHSITAANPQNGTIKVDSLAVPGDTVTFYVSADNGYEVKNIQVYKTGETNVSVTKVAFYDAYRFTMPDYPVTISAETELLPCSIQWNTTHCTVDGPSQGRAGDEVTFTVTPEEGYRVRTISVNGDTRYGIDRTDVNDSTYTYQMTLKAINTGTYTVNVVCDNENEAGFEISREFGLGSASITNASGEEITRAEGGERIRIQLLNGDGVRYNTSCFIPKDASIGTGERNLTGDNTFVMPFCDMKVVLFCAAKIFHLTIADGMEHGNVSSTKVGEVLFNSTVFFTITPERGYKLEKLLMGDVDVTGQVSENTYECGMPARDVNVSATFKLATYHIDYDLNGGTNNELNPSDYTVLTEDFTLREPTRECFIFTGWTGTDLNEPTNNVTITKGSIGDRTYTATWKKLLTHADIIVADIPAQTYTGNTITPTVTVKDGETDITDQCDFAFTGNTNAGSATVTITAKSASTGYAGSTTKTFTISKANSVAAAVTANNRTYDGTDQPLVTVTGETKGGEMKYYSARVENPVNPPTAPADDLYTTSIPTATDAGTYYVWYKVKGDNNHNDVAAQKIEITIKGVITPAVSITGWTYGDTANTPSVTGNDGNGEVTYKYYMDSDCNTETTAENSGAASEGGVPKNAGTYYVKATVAETVNYTSGTAITGFTIKKTNPNVTAPAAKDLTYIGEEQELIKAGDANYGTLQYSTDGTNYSADIPTGTDAGNYTIYYKVVGNNNVEDVAAQSITATIKCRVSFNANEGSGTMANVGVEKDTPYTLPACTFTAPDGKAFDKWQIGDTEYAAGAEVTIADNISVKALWKNAYTDNIGAQFYGYSLSLDGNIGVNFYMELDNSVISDETAFMRFTLPSGTSDVYVKDIKDTANGTEKIGGKTYYIFRCEVNAMNMTYAIKARMHTGTGENEKIGEEYSYSVKDYADYLVAHKDDKAEFTNAVPVVKAMLNYGAYSQVYFNHAADALANANTDTVAEAEKDVSSVTAEMINKPYTGDTNVFENVTFTGVDMVLRSETVLRMYFTNKTGTELTVTAPKGTVEQSGETIVVSFANIKSYELDNDFTVTLSDGSNNGSISYCPLTYCYNVLNRGTEGGMSAELQDVVRSLYLYNKAANKYFHK